MCVYVCVEKPLVETPKRRLAYSYKNTLHRGCSSCVPELNTYQNKYNNYIYVYVFTEVIDLDIFFINANESICIMRALNSTAFKFY